MDKMYTDNSTEIWSRAKVDEDGIQHGMSYERINVEIVNDVTVLTICHYGRCIVTPLQDLVKENEL